MIIRQSIIAAFLLSAAATSVYAKAQYNNDQFNRFEQTNRCSGCDISGAKLKYNHSGAVADGANLSGILEGGFPGINFSSSDLRNANLSGAILPFANFSQADLTGAHFDGAELQYANFYGAVGLNLTNAHVCSAILPNGTQTKSC